MSGVAILYRRDGQPRWLCNDEEEFTLERTCVCVRADRYDSEMLVSQWPCERCHGAGVLPLGSRRDPEKFFDRIVSASVLSVADAHELATLNRLAELGVRWSYLPERLRGAA